MNHCARCKIELEDLYLIRYCKYLKKDGSISYSYHCKACKKNYCEKWNKAHQKERNEATRRSYLKHREKALVRRKVQRAIESGLIVRGNCENCGDLKSQAHHDDYSQPLKIRWLCISCHATFHKRERLELLILNK